MSCPAQLYDAAIVANGSHAAAWHGWGLLEKRQGNPLRARDLWMKVGCFLLACTASQQLAKPLLICHQPGVRMCLVVRHSAPDMSCTQHVRLSLCVSRS